jgi:hypothetical protein
MNPADALHAIASQQTIPIDPQDLAQRVGVSPIGLPARPPHRLHHDHVVATIICPQTFDQPIVKSAHFQDGHVGLLVGSTFLVNLVQELVYLLPASAHLPAEHHIAKFVAKGYGHLLAMEVDSEVQHGRFSWFAAPHAAGKSLWRAHAATPFTARRTFLSSLS